MKSADLVTEWIEFERGVRFGNCNVSLGKGECWISTQFEATFAIRLIGPALIKASFELRSGNMLKYVFDVFDSGDYDVEVLMIYDNWDVLNVEFPSNMTVVLDRRISALGKKFIHLKVDFLPEFKESCQTFKEVSSGRWVRSNALAQNFLKFTFQDTVWEWKPVKCKASFLLKPCDRRIYLIGDSFMLGWSMHLDTFKLRRINGLFSKDNENDRKYKFWKREHIFCREFDLINQEIDSFNPDFIVVNSGHWDLRDLSKEKYLSDFYNFWKHCRLNHSRVIWRTIPPFSLNHKPGGLYVQDYRSNEKIEFVNRISRQYLARHHLDYYDSWSILSPFWDHPCDAHHYLCSKNSTIGLVDLSLFNAFACLS
jgi:hypothetical protein